MPQGRWFWSAGQLLGRVLLLGLCRVRVFGERNVPAKGGVLIISNHQSFLDPVLLSLAPKRPLNYMARRSLFDLPVFGGLIRRCNAFPVTREGRDISAFRESVRRLEAGRGLVLFPEGTRTHDGEIGLLQPGVLRIARRARVPVVPACIEGAFRVWPRGHLPRVHPVAVAYAPAVTPETYERLSEEELLAQLRETMVNLQSQLKDYLNCARGGHREA